MAADIDIINSALRKLGERAIPAVSESSPAARLANQTYEDLRDAFLREFQWNFATKRTSLAADVEAPAWEFEFQYTLPSDYLRLIEVNNLSESEWRLEGGKILTNREAPLEIKYVGSVLAGEMDPAFRDALAQRLAMEWAEALTQTTSVGEQMARLYQNKLRVARSADGQEDRLLRMTSSTFIDARFGGGGFDNFRGIE